jgi:chromosome condensin MukBEF ATPase and DNA-binding subunit MukB
MSADPSEAKAKLEEARKMVTECDKEMQNLKRKIRELGTDGGDPNSLELVVLKVSNHLVVSLCRMRRSAPMNGF